MNPLPILLVILAMAPPMDRVILSNGEILEGRLLGMRARRLRIEIRIGQGRAEFACEPQRIARIEPGTPFAPAKLPVAANAKLALLQPLWTELEPLLHIPGSDAGAIGLALAGARVETGDLNRAIPLLERLASTPPDATLRHRANGLRVQALIMRGELDAALQVAREISGETDDPSAIALANLAKGRVEMGLTNLDTAVDHFLQTYLLSPDLREEAAQGLWEASRIASLCSNAAPAMRWLQTIVSDYSNTTVFAAASAALSAKATNQPQKVSR